MPTMPTLTRAANSRAARPLRVKMATPLPYWCLLGRATRFLERLGAHDLQHRAEDFLLVGLHVGLHMVEQRRADEEAVLVALQLEAAAVDDQLGALVDADLDVVLDLARCARR